MNAALPLHVTRVQRLLTGVGIAALVLAGVTACVWPASLLPAYRFTLFACLAPTIGSLLFLLIHRCTGGAWGEPLQPFLAVAGRLAPWIWLGIAPLLLFSPTAFAPGWSYDSHAMLIVRAVFYAVVLFGVAVAVARSRAAWVGPAGLLALLFTLHLLSDDWLVALEPGWSSTAFSLVWLIGQAVAGLSVAILVALLRGVSPASAGATPARPLGIDWGNLLLTAAMLWCYVMFAQFLIIWAGNVPRETTWFLRRLQGGWVIVPVVLVGLNFVAPLVLLLSRERKRSAWSLGIAGALLLLGQCIYLAWAIVPAFPVKPAWSGFVAAVALGDAALAFGLRHILNPNGSRGGTTMIDSAQLPPPDYEPRDIPPCSVVLMAVLLAAMLAGVLAASAWIYHARYAHGPTTAYAAGEKSFTHGADWQSSIARDWADQDRRTRENLTTYGWVDRKAGVVRIPIERAMTLVAHEAKP